MMLLPLVYIAGPYTNPDPVINTRRAIQTGLKLYELGLAVPEIPHLSLLTHLVEPREVDFWYQFDKEKLVHCHFLLRLEGESTGADAEVESAREWGIPVMYDKSGWDDGSIKRACEQWIARHN